MSEKNEPVYKYHDVISHIVTRRNNCFKFFRPINSITIATEHKGPVCIKFTNMQAINLSGIRMMDFQFGFTFRAKYFVRFEINDRHKGENIGKTKFFNGII